MSAARLTVVLLPGHDADPAAVAATIETVRAEAGPEAPVLALDGAGTVPTGCGVALTAPEEILTSAELLAFARPGDRWRPGALTYRLLPLEARDGAVLGVAAHALVDAQGRELHTVRPPLPPLDPAELLLRASIEASGVLVRAAALDAQALALLAMPHGDAVLWSRLARAHGLVPTMEVAADVPLDPARHGSAAPRTLDVLLAAATGAEADLPGGVTLRRELLRRLFVETDRRTEIEIAVLLGDAGRDPRAAAVVADLQWTLERQRDALAAERVGWARGEVDPGDELPLERQEMAIELSAQADWLHREVALRDRQVERLLAELRLRDATVGHLNARLHERERELARLAAAGHADARIGDAISGADANAAPATPEPESVP